MKLLESSAAAAAVSAVRDAMHAILIAAHTPQQALQLWQRTLCGEFQDLLCCVLAADPSTTFGVTFGEVAWRLMHVQHVAHEAAKQKSVTGGATSDVATGAHSQLHVPSPVQVIAAITATPDNTPGVSMLQDKYSDAQQPSTSSQDAGKPIEVRARAMALLPLAASGAFGKQNLLDPSCRPHTLKNACASLTSTAQRVDVLISVLCALSSQSSVLRAHACHTAASLVNSIEVDGADVAEKSVLCVARAVQQSQKALEASAHALENVLSSSPATGMHHVVLHALCPIIKDMDEAAQSASSLLHADSSIPGVATGAVRSCMTAIIQHGPHALGTLFKILCQQVGGAAAVVTTHAYVPCIMQHAVALLDTGMPAGSLLGLALDILRSYEKLPEGAVVTSLPDDVYAHVTAMSGDQELRFSPGGVLTAVLETRAAPKEEGVKAPVTQHAQHLRTSGRCACLLCITVLWLPCCDGCLWKTVYPGAVHCGPELSHSPLRVRTEAPRIGPCAGYPHQHLFG